MIWLILFLIFIILLKPITETFKSSSIPRSIYTKYGRLTDSHWSSNKLQTAFDNPCLTEKPYSFVHFPTWVWKNWNFFTEKKYLHCDRYSCQTGYQNGYTAEPVIQKNPVQVGPTISKSITKNYYPGSTPFCANNPNTYPCINWWVKNPEQIPDKTVDIRRPKLVEGLTPQVAYHSNDIGFCIENETNPDCQFQDGKPVLFLTKQTSIDRALC